nr:C40 family peptidase [Candidatus Symbiobacter mobilis]
MGNLLLCFLLLVLLGGCASTPPASQGGGDGRLTTKQANDVTVYALSLIGTPYRYGGNTPQSGFDCSGLVQHVYRTRAGIVTPRTVAAMQRWGRAIPQSALRSGDLVLFGTRSPPDHAGIYVGKGRFVHAPSTGGVVRLDHLDSRHWSRRLLGSRRP